MQALTQIAWQDGVQSSRPQHSSEHCRCWAEVEQASCARAAWGAMNASAPAQTAANRTHRVDMTNLQPSGLALERTIASGVRARHPRAAHNAPQVLRE
jgi:hypothetical protein